MLKYNCDLMFNSQTLQEKRYKLHQEYFNKKVQNGEKEFYTFLDIFSKLSQLTFGCIAAHQLIYLTLEKQHFPSSKGFINQIAKNYQQTRRLTELSIINFSSKIFVDAYVYQNNLFYSEYEKGGMAGVIAFLVNRPLQQMETIRKDVFFNNKRKLGRVQATALIWRWEGLKGFYKYENLLGPASSGIYRSLYFGVYYSLASHNNHILNMLLLYPLYSTMAATFSTVILDKCRNYCINVHKYRQSKLRSSGKKVIAFSRTVTRELLTNFRQVLKIDSFERAAIAHNIFKNWILLSFFIFGQSEIMWEQQILSSFILDLNMIEQNLPKRRKYQ